MASERFWRVALAHAAFVVAFKVFENFSSAILVERFGYDVSKAGLLGSVVPLTSAVLTPVTPTTVTAMPSAETHQSSWSSRTPAATVTTTGSSAGSCGALSGCSTL